MNIKKGDTVVVIAGEGKGKKGKVLFSYPTKERIIVEGVNMVTKHKKPQRNVTQGGIIHQEAPIHVSNVMLWDEKANAPTRVSYKVLEDGTKVRVSKKSGEIIK